MWYIKKIIIKILFRGRYQTRGIEDETRKLTL